jgi:hypothetical protein
MTETRTWKKIGRRRRTRLVAYVNASSLRRSFYLS